MLRTVIRATAKKRLRAALLLGSSALGLSAQAFAGTAQDPRNNQIAEVVVTATKRSEKLQDVPISVQALGTASLEQHQVQSFDDYAKLLPSVSFQSFGPGQSDIYFRGVTSGGDGLHGGSTPASGLYVDEIPLTTIANNVDLHVYDMERVEALSGPQGTLFGASSLSGTLRLITNKPSTAKFSAGYDLEGNDFEDGAAGGTAEGFVNLPLNDKAAVRLVGYYEHDGGYINNTPKSRTFTLNDGDPTTNLTVNNDQYVKKNFNSVDSIGGRAALKIDLDDNWTILPSAIYQHEDSHGAFLFDPKAGDLNVHDFTDDINKDRWYQTALTIQGKISDWDVVYAGGNFGRTVENVIDYSYYTVAYDGGSRDGSFSYTYFPTGTGSFLDPTQHQIEKDVYNKQSHELRFSSPANHPLRLTTGLFYERQSDYIAADYQVKGISNLPPANLVFPVPIPGFGDSVFRTRDQRIDRDTAIFADGAWDILSNLTLDMGIRGFATRNSQEGFSGYASNVAQSNCLATTAKDRPCDNVHGVINEAGETHKINLSWKFEHGKMLYVTYSTGYRPGGINRRQGVLPYKSDTLANYEAGWKTTWLDHSFLFDGAVFMEDWNKLQFGLSPIGSNGVTNIYNAGNARIFGLESNFDWRISSFEISGSGTLTDAKLTTNFCQFDAVGNSVCLPGVTPAAPKGTPLPVQPPLKASLSARYNFELFGSKSWAMATIAHQSHSRAFLTAADEAAVGDLPQFSTIDLSAGIDLGARSLQIFIQNATDTRGELSRNTACAPEICGAYYRVYPTKPMLIGAKLSQRF